MVSARILTQAYTAVVCSADFSLTDFPLELMPKKKLYGLLQKLFFGLAREGKSLDRNGIFMTHLLKMGAKKAPAGADA